jgi:WD40 repeat protein
MLGWIKNEIIHGRVGQGESVARQKLTLHIPDEFLDASFIPGGRLMTRSYDNAIRVWDAETGQELNLWRRASAMGPLFNQEAGKLLTMEDENTLGILDAQSGQALLTLTDPLSKITTFTRDGRRIFTGHDNGEIKLWDPATGRQIDALRGHRGAVTNFVIANDRRGGLQTMVTVVDRAMAQLWDLKNRNLISTFSEEEIQNLGYAIGAKWFWTLVDWKTVRFRDMRRPHDQDLGSSDGPFARHSRRPHEAGPLRRFFAGRQADRLVR